MPQRLQIVKVGRQAQVKLAGVAVGVHPQAVQPVDPAVERLQLFLHQPGVFGFLAAGGAFLQTVQYDVSYHVGSLLFFFQYSVPAGIPSRGGA